MKLFPVTAPPVKNDSATLKMAWHMTLRGKAKEKQLSAATEEASRPDSYQL